MEFQNYIYGEQFQRRYVNDQEKPLSRPGDHWFYRTLLFLSAIAIGKRIQSSVAAATVLCEQLHERRGNGPDDFRDRVLGLCVPGSQPIEHEERLGVCIGDIACWTFLCATVVSVFQRT